MAEELEQVVLFEEFLERKFHVGIGLHPDHMYAFIEFLKINASCFAWSHEDMTGILMEISVQNLSLDPNIPPVRQKKRPIAEVGNKFIKEEVTRLLKIGSIREVTPEAFARNI
ncbi:uncharacterized protein [Nicotiana tomentosiformis]|uniref:uncharacterized protein n=1 Tax=Nicotiana tomentosiformis TaxID=4098 RepID=UPI00388C96E4